jgi:hypothetical protein
VSVCVCVWVRACVCVCAFRGCIARGFISGEGPLVLRCEGLITAGIEGLSPWRGCEAARVGLCVMVCDAVCVCVCMHACVDVLFHRVLTDLSVALWSGAPSLAFERVGGRMLGVGDGPGFDVTGQQRLCGYRAGPSRRVALMTQMDC